MDLSKASVTELRAELNRREKISTKIDKALARLNAKAAALVAQQQAVGFTEARARNATNKVKLPDAIVGVLKDHPKGLSLQAITDALLRSGYNTTSANFRAVVNQAILQNKKNWFRRVSIGVYKLNKKGG